MAEPPPKDLTDVVSRSRGGDPGAVKELAPLVYDQMRRLASSYLQRERADHTLQPTALANEAYLKLVDHSRVEWQDRNHFLAVAAQAMRRILIDYARAQKSSRRAADRQRITLSEISGQSDDSPGSGGKDGTIDILQLDQALTQLSERSERQARVVELRYFGGLTVPETAGVLDVSERTIKADWRVAKAWLRKLLADAEPTTADSSRDPAGEDPSDQELSDGQPEG